MKFRFQTLLVFFLCTALSLSVCADTFTDQCSSDLSTPSRETYNLSLFSSYLEDLQIPEIVDKTALGISDLSSVGEIIYSVKNPEEVTVSTYRLLASYAVKRADGTLSYGTALPNENYELLPLWLDESTDDVYCLDNGVYYLLRYQEDIGYDFSSDAEQPEHELVPYGLTIMQSFDGATFHPVESELIYTTRFVSSSSPELFHEIYHAPLSSDCRYLKIRLKQFSKIKSVDLAGQEGTLELSSSYFPAMINKVEYITASKPLNPDGGAELPLEDEEQTVYGDPSKYEKRNHSSVTQKSSSSSSSSSSAKSTGSNGDSTNTTSTTSSVEHTTSTTTSDSNNTSSTNNYTTNNYYFYFSENAREILQQIAEEGQLPAELSESVQADSDRVSADTQTTVVFNDSISVGASAENMSTTSATDSTEDKRLFYLTLTGICAIITLQIINILKPSHHKNNTHDDDSDDDFDMEE